MSAAGRLFLPALRLDREPLAVIERQAADALEHEVGGFILFGGRTSDVERLCARWREAAGRPLWIAADLERGPGQQFAGAPTLPPPAALAVHPEAERAVAEAGRLTGRVARELGVNWVLAPVLDLDVEPDNPIIGTRSFGSDPARVARLGRVWIEACQSTGTAACAKHFPGHGRTRTDSHLGLPVVEAAAATLEAELEPFRSAAPIVAGVMTAHVAYPTLGSVVPATLSPRIVHDLLRGGLGFEGLIVTDAMIMTGLGGRDSGDEGPAVAALRAGCDLLLYPADLEESVRAVEETAASDRRFGAQLAAAVARSEGGLRAWGADMRAPPLNGEAAVSDSGGGAALALAAECVLGEGSAARAVLDSARPTCVRVVFDDRSETGLIPFGAPFVEELGRLGWTVERATNGAEGSQCIVLLAATPQAWKGHAGVSAEALETVRAELSGGPAGRPAAYLVVFGHRRRLDDLPAPAACAWATEPVMQRAAARWIDRQVR